MERKSSERDKTTWRNHLKLAVGGLAIGATFGGLFGAAITPEGANNGISALKTYARDQLANPLPELSEQTAQKTREIVGVDTGIVCEDSLQAVYNGTTTPFSGYVRSYHFGPDPNVPIIKLTGRIHIDSKFCEQVAGIDTSEKSSELDSNELISLGVILHERAHETGVFDEAKAECIALQELPKQTIASGAADRETFAKNQYEIMKWYDSLPDGYHDETRCRVGGEWDEAADNRGMLADSQILLPNVG